LTTPLDYMRTVIENGKHFTNKNFFMMLRELDHNHVDENAAKFLGIMKEELGITNEELEEYLRKMNIE
jgi:hypothetical protein